MQQRVQKKASKRAKVDKLSIEAALKNTSNIGIRLAQRDEEILQRDEEVNKVQSKGKKVLKGEGNSKNVHIFSDGDSSEESFSDEEFRKDYSSGDDSNESSSEDEFPLSKIFKKTMSRKKKEKTKRKKKTSKKERLTNFFSSEESSEDDLSRAEKDTDIVERDTIRDLSKKEFSGREGNERKEPSESNLPSTQESHKSKKSKRSSRPSAFTKVGGSRMKVIFNDRGQPIGEASVRFSSVLGGIAAEMVPLNCCDWRSIPARLKSTYWLTVQQKFIIDEAHKAYTLQQIEKLWRAYKSRLRKRIRACKSKKELKEAKPEDVGEREWIRFAKEVFRRSFMKKSKRFQELRSTQDLPHTCSRKGYARLEDEMKKESPNPESITRVDVWSKGHTKKDGTPSNTTVFETLEKIREYREATTSVASSQGIDDDALSKIFGPERWGRVRGLGSGVTPSKIGVVSNNKAHMTQLQEEVGTLKEKMTRQNEQIARQNELIKKLVAAVQLQEGESIVDLGTSIPDVSALPKNTMHPSRNIDVSKVQQVETTQHISEPQATSNPSQSGSTPQVGGNANMVGRKCKLMNWSGTKEIVAIGRWDTNEPNSMVHSIRLGENASRVWVDDVINGIAPLWRTTSCMGKVAEAKGTTVAWPNESIIFDDDN